MTKAGRQLLGLLDAQISKSRRPGGAVAPKCRWAGSAAATPIPAIGGVSFASDPGDPLRLCHPSGLSVCGTPGYSFDPRSVPGGLRSGRRLPKRHARAYGLHSCGDLCGGLWVAVAGASKFAFVRMSAAQLDAVLLWALRAENAGPELVRPVVSAMRLGGHIPWKRHPA